MHGIVVGVDDSPDAARALSWGVDFAEQSAQPLTVLTVLEPSSLAAVWSDDPGDASTGAHVEAARTAARHLVNDLEADRGRRVAVPVTVHVHIGHPVKTLVEASEDADLLVVGSRGTGEFGRLLVGSVSDGVLHHAKCPVAVIRPTDHAT